MTSQEDTGTHDDIGARTHRAPPDDFKAAYGESLSDVLNVESWHIGENPGAMYARIESEIAGAVEQERRVHGQVRRDVLARIQRLQLVPGAGIFKVATEQIKRVHEGLLMAGAVEACDATRHAHETLPLTVIQIGVSLVSYNGNLGTWTQQLFRRDLRQSLPDPVEEAIRLLEQREIRRVGERDDPSELLHRAIMTYAERAILLKRSRPGSWLMGHGNPVAQELLSRAAGSFDLTAASIRLLEELICGHKRFVFVPSAPVDRAILTIGDALGPLEYAIVRPLRDQIAQFLDSANYNRRTYELVRDFRDEVADKVAVGVYRASEVAPARVFYAHVEHAHEAAAIALADSQLQPHRGFPMLLDVADRVCAATLGPDTLAGPIQAAYTRAGAPLRYLGERMTRGR
jgi:hypothetical protein